MNRPLARRAGPFLMALTGLPLPAAGAVPCRLSKTLAPTPVAGAPKNPGAVLRLEPVEATTTR